MISKILKLVEDKVGAIKLLVFICIGAIVELLSIAALLPAIFLISNPCSGSRTFNILETENIVNKVICLIVEDDELIISQFSLLIQDLQ